MAMLENLPAELLLPILKQLDLASLYGLICAVPRAWHLFSACPLEILQSVIPISLPACHGILPRTLAAWRLASTSPSRYPEAPASLQGRLQGACASAGSTALCLPLYTPVVARHVLLTAARIACLEDVVLAELLRRMHAIRPSHLKDKAYVFYAAATWSGRHDGAVGQFPEGLPYTPDARWPPSVPERLRVRIALWRCFVLEAIRRERNQAVEEFANRSLLSTDDLVKMVGIVGPAEVGNVHKTWRLTDAEKHELLCVSDVLCDLFMQPLDTDWNPWCVRREDTAAVLRVLAELGGQTRDWAPSRDAVSEQTWKQHISGLPGGNLGWHFFAGRLIQAPASPLVGLEVGDFRVLRRYGLGIWDQQRLAGLRLVNEVPTWGENALSEQDLYQAWRSIVFIELERDGANLNSRGLQKQRMMWNIQRGYQGLPLISASRLQSASPAGGEIR